MDFNDLKEYLNIVTDMERNIYLQNSLLSQMQNRYAQLGQVYTYQEPIAPKEDESLLLFSFMFIASIIFALICFFLLRYGIGLCNYGIGEFLIGVIIILLSAPLFLTSIITTVIIPIVTLVGSIKENESYEQAKREYEVAYAEYERKMRMDQERLRKEQFEKEVLFKEIQSLQKQNDNSKQNLKQIYSQNIIYPKYRNLIMICSIYEYICSGRCTTLEGHEGAYNILELEIRLNRIITRLDLVITRLDVIQNNQYLLYSTIQETNHQIAGIIESTNNMIDSLNYFRGQAEEMNAKIASLEQNSALTAYQTQSIEKELHYMNRMNYFSGKYNHILYNSPPT